MSISRFLHEFRPLFRMLDEPLRGAPTLYSFPHRSFLADPFLPSPTTVHPALDLTEEGDNYVVEAELPGVKKENIDISVGDGGRSVTIQGRTSSRPSRSGDISGSTTESSTTQGEGAGTGAVVSSSETPSNQLTTERLYSGTSSFTRTVWLPRSVDSSKITAKLTDGVLTLRAPKMEDKESIKINVD
ncbi:HSP20-like chaperone [Boletus reticuloceps]|uniref:HSP20-like chaperone n=1 Tax=Boletus reticuloceps TaxID=495285 RepID=A0A8I2YTB6_9AGAM|nr:HSP20-like chaperone [Boletus reticuloceps]